MLFVVLIGLVSSKTVYCTEGGSTTTKSYDLEIPGSKPIRIIEGESLWQHTTVKPPGSRFEHRSLAFTTDQTASLKSPLEDDYQNEPSSDALKKFLNQYISQRNKFVTSQEASSMENVELVTKPSSNSAESFERSKNWDLLNYQKHNHPYDDKKGWISMEPVPWSISKISKWQSHHQKPITQRPPWELDYDSNSNNNDEKYYNNYDNSHRYKPSSQKPSPNYQIYIVDKNKPSSPQVITGSNSKPFSIYGQKVQSHHHSNNQYKHGENCDHNSHNSDIEFGDIITDGLPPNFPSAQHYSDNSNRRRGTEIHSEVNPLSGEGEWVLLSTTKGYKHPQQRQRSLQITPQPQSVGTRRSVRLTVLPPLKNSKVNMTTSHGGLLQVESTFQSVEQAKDQYLKRLQKLKIKKGPQKQSQHKPQNQQQQQTVRQIIAAPVSTRQTNTVPDTSAVLAAVGAGMIPATMAMLVPMAMNGRRKRDVRLQTMRLHGKITRPMMTKSI